MGCRHFSDLFLVAIIVLFICCSFLQDGANGQKAYKSKKVKQSSAFSSYANSNPYYSQAAPAAVAVKAAPSAPRRICTECNSYACQEPIACSAGVAKDICDCCQTCGKKEGQQCDIDLVNDQKGMFDRSIYTPIHGRCGDYLECVFMHDAEMSPNATDNALCQCADQRPVCGSDRRTYATKCKFYETMANRREAETNVQIDRFEPCDEVPKIVTPPRSIEESEGQAIMLSCEVSGFPPPKVEWIFQKSDGTSQVMPGDNLRISVQARGGPETREITSWLHLQNLSKADEGTYTCIGKNKLGRSSAASQVRIFRRYAEF